jgi:hypothetical protein
LKKSNAQTPLSCPGFLSAALIFASILGIGNVLFAAALCVNPGGTGVVFSTIGAALAAALPNDPVKVAAGAYSQYVMHHATSVLSVLYPEPGYYQHQSIPYCRGQ